MATPLHDAAQCVSRAGDHAIREPPQPRIGRGRLAYAAALPDAVERRRHAVFGGDRGRAHRAHPLFRSCRRRASERPPRARGCTTRPRHARHGRYQRRYRLYRRRRPARSHRKYYRAPASGRARARYGDDLRGRRLDCLDRCGLPQCRAPERRRRSGPSLLRARGRRANSHRCRPRMRLSEPGLLPWRRAQPRCRGSARNAQSAHCRSVEHGGGCGRCRHSAHRRYAHGRRDTRLCGQARRRSVRLHAVTVWWRRWRACGGRRRRTRHAQDSGAATTGSILRAWAAVHRRGARLHPL